MIAEARTERELAICERDRAAERDAGAGKVLLGDVEAAERRERTRAPVRSMRIFKFASKLEDSFPN